ncbi:MAG: hypothetical protein DI530_08855 [Sphingomonas sp.]|uniref:YrhB domain-containing protein n=1 Tax=Sphingomonas sp. TaxID=28214 RepID=UPI000DBBB533|nr:YrhB domain-containing protein [Sphingomonas sp.]PZU79339.1 MAG: hypothetical protein DI530_08855 [Sphingomonas sp.]
MNRSDARTLAEAHVAAMDGAADLAINDKLTEEHEAGHLFFYNTRRYWRTRDMIDGVAGNGPLLVRHDGRIVTLPSSLSVEESLSLLQRDDLPAGG